MAKIHTHYDNLKVARMAPQEVIRAAYKALSQKYHPDKNAGDEKAARIMAIVNTAYGILSDPVRRKEHDEWIAAEEWEIAWLESNDEEGGKGNAAASHAPFHPWEPSPVPTRIRQRLLREPLTWLVMAAVFTVGCVVGTLALPPVASLRTAAAPVRQAPVLVAPAAAPTPAPVPVAAAGPVPAAGADDWVAPRTDKAGLLTLAVMELAVPARPADCSTQLHGATAPNGSPWPLATGYVDGYAIANKGEHMRVNIDNAANDTAVFVRLIDLDRGASVRHAYVLPHEALSIDKLSAGRYQVRYQNVDPGGVRGNCTLAALKPAATAP